MINDPPISGDQVFLWMKEPVWIHKNAPLVSEECFSYGFNRLDHRVQTSLFCLTKEVSHLFTFCDLAVKRVNERKRSTFWGRLFNFPLPSYPIFKTPTRQYRGVMGVYLSNMESTKQYPTVYFDIYLHDSSQLQAYLDEKVGELIGFITKSGISVT